MRELADSAESTMQELESMKTRAYSMTAQQQRCEYCSDLLLGKAFYLFPCSHGFHCHCLVQRCTQHLSPAQVRLQCTDSNSGNNVARCTILLHVCTVYMCLLSLCNCFCAQVVVRYSVSCLDECVCYVYGSVVLWQLLLRASGGAVQCVVPWRVCMLCI
jgi:hypothetical protein